MSGWIKLFVNLLFVTLIAIPTGMYIRQVMSGQKTWLSPVVKPVENWVYKLLHVNPDQQMSWKQYFLCVVCLSLGSFALLWILLMIQGWLPGNPQHAGNMNWDLALNTAVSYITNTNWQAYMAERQVSSLVQCIGLTVQNFISAAAGMSVLFAFIRGFTKVQDKGLGSFWQDFTRSLLYVLLPFSMVLSLLLMAGGVIQNFDSSNSVALTSPIAVDESGSVIANADIDLQTNTVSVDGKPVQDATIIKEQYVPMGPAASQIAIKQLGSNGGGFFTTNSAHPFENPNWFTNLLESASILLIPMSLCFSFGSMIRNKKQGIALFAAMFVGLAICMSCMYAAEQKAPASLAQNEYINTSDVMQSGGNMEGKESRFGIADSVIWSSYTTASSNGSVNSSLDDYTPLGGMMAMILMQTGSVFFGGVGCGLYTMLGFVILTVFISGLMVGRTPEFLGKKIDPYEMRWSVILTMASAVIILITSTIAALVPSVFESSSASGAHGFSQLLYAFTSAGANNGSAFAGFNANTVMLNTLLSIAMLFARFVPMMAALAIAYNLAGKKRIASGAGTLATNNTLFVFMLLLIVVLVGALSFFPALSLGPLAEQFV